MLKKDLFIPFCLALAAVGVPFALDTGGRVGGNDSRASHFGEGVQEANQRELVVNACWEVPVLDMVDLQGGEVVAWNLGFIDDEIGIQDALPSLTEDLAQVHYNGGVVLDVGWYPECSLTGHFVVMVVVDGAWDTPVFSGSATSFSGLREEIQRAAIIARASSSALGGA